MPVTLEEMMEKDPLDQAFDKHGITAEYLIQKLKEELCATYKNKTKAWTIRQRARMDAHKLLGQYPSEKMIHDGKVDLEGKITVKFISPEDTEEDGD